MADIRDFMDEDFNGFIRIDNYKSANSINYPLLKENARINRNYPTEAEKKMWDILRKEFKDYRFRRQHIIGDYIVDFINLSDSIVIEVDGGYHQEDAQQIRDEERTEWLNTNGFKVVRFTNEEVLFNSDLVVNQLRLFFP